VRGSTCRFGKRAQHRQSVEHACRSDTKQAYQKDEPSPGDLGALRNLESMTKHAMFVFFLSRQEWTFRKLVTFLFPVSCDRGGAAFKSIYDFLLKQLGLDRYIPLYDVWRHVRNSVHSNGIFISRSGRDESVTWKGTTYSFYHMRPIDFMNYRRMFSLYHDLIDSIEDILKTQPVSSPAFIEDRIH